MVEQIEMYTGKEAIIKVCEDFGITSKYALAKALSCDTVTVQPIQIYNYLNGRQMSEKVAQRFSEVFGIVISDVYSAGSLRQWGRK